MRSVGDRPWTSAETKPAIWIAVEDPLETWVGGWPGKELAGARRPLPSTLSTASGRATVYDHGDWGGRSAGG